RDERVRRAAPSRARRRALRRGRSRSATLRAEPDPARRRRARLQGDQPPRDAAPRARGKPLDVLVLPPRVGGALRGALPRRRGRHGSAAPAGRPARPGERPPGRPYDPRDALPERPPPRSHVTPGFERMVASRGGGSREPRGRAAPSPGGHHPLEGAASPASGLAVLQNPEPINVEVEPTCFGEQARGRLLERLLG